MKLTLTLQGKHSNYSGHFSLRQLISALVLLSLIFLVSSRSTTSTQEQIARIQLAQQAVTEESQDVANLQAKVDSQLAVYATEISQLKFTLAQLENTSNQLSSKLEVDFSSSEEHTHTVSTAAVIPIQNEIDALKEQTVNKQRQLSILEKVYLGHHLEEQVQLSGRPVEWGWLTSSYGLRKDPFTGKEAMHKGVDFAGKDEGNVISTGAGIVSWAGERHGYGLLVEVDHGNGLVTRYGHNSELNVRVGDVVTKGDTLAAMGNTGRSTGVHVHYEVLKNGKQVDPLAYIK
ncbi:M23 family metallopeptidase [Alteromonas sp. 5E99-2]|uniref:M23 family metallopeptidase n=1 Tax=Alteromonas sp. 5E99-2 TaxID=2817683 RepID=UPI001A99B377|nr:M23 family metallopeptidase [Alteromonas sp. 5E99-2]MBO1256429.1 M23 family metallopeptidase [Alteromonas sp. 5E99-2]